MSGRTSKNLKFPTLFGDGYMDEKNADAGAENSATARVPSVTPTPLPAIIRPDKQSLE